MKYLFSFFVFCVLATACNKNVTELPAATDTGANTFGATVDGVLWTPKGFGVVPTAPILEARLEGDNLVINARNFAHEPTETEFEIYLYHLWGPGIYALNANTNIYPSQSGNYAYYVERKITPQQEWLTTSESTGSVIITKLDTTNHIVAGTFSFTAANKYGGKPAINVTDGRFDIKIP